MTNNKEINRKRIIANATSWIVTVMWVAVVSLGIYSLTIGARVTNTQRIEPKTTQTQEYTIAEKEYTVKGKVTYTNGNLFTLTTADGNEWECYAEGYSINDVVEITFNNNKTINAYDDSIVRLYKLSN